MLPKFKLELALVELILTPSSPLNMSCLSSTHCLTGGKHLGCYSPPPLKESRPEIQDGRLLWKRDMLPVSNISDSFRLHSIEASEGPKWLRQLSILVRCIKFLLEEFPSLASIKHCYIGRNPR